MKQVSLYKLHTSFADFRHTLCTRTCNQILHSRQSTQIINARFSDSKGKCYFLSVYYTTQGIQTQWSNVGHFSKPQIWDYSPEYSFYQTGLPQQWSCQQPSPAQSVKSTDPTRPHCWPVPAPLPCHNPCRCSCQSPWSSSVVPLSPCSPDPNHHQCSPTDPAFQIYLD